MATYPAPEQDTRAGAAPSAWPCRARSRAGAAVLVLLAACSPALDWREVRPADSHLQLLFPCKPVQQARRVMLAGQNVRLVLHVCNAGEQTWALAHADMGDPTHLGPALRELLGSAAANLGAAPGTPLPLQVAGATPHGASARWRLSGQLPDGVAVVEEVAVFAYGTRVYQATALGPELPLEMAQTFMASLRVVP